MLVKSATHPVMRAAAGGNKADLEKEQMLEIVTKSAQTLREEYLLRLESVRIEITRRVAHLRMQKASQLAALDKLNLEKAPLRDKAADLSERYEDLKDNGDRLTSRIELALQRLQSQVPIGSDAELRMQRQLQELDRRTREMRNAMERIAAKEKYQMRQIEQRNEQMEKQEVDKNNWRGRGNR
jgi:predicted  nucleic acid-binding Zn-ribbon protein